jgi:eukaryotic-like serine/threonine-protein kinase
MSSDAQGLALTSVLGRVGATLDPEPGLILGFQPVHRVAESYLGSLWVALDKRRGEPGRPVLLRRVQLPAPAGIEALQRMACAARDAMALSHENVATVVAVLQQDDALAVAYEYLEAEPLRTWQAWATHRALSFPVPVSLRILSDLLRGVRALHGTLLGWPSAPPFGGLSPDSVLVGRDGRTRLCDPLIASCATLLEGFGLNAAKLAYAAPEQVHATAPLAPALDVFACGVLLWELLAGRRMLSGSRDAIERRLLEHDLPRLVGQLRPEQQVSEALLSLVERSLSADPGRRPPTPAALASELEQCGHQMASVAEVAQFMGELSGRLFEQRGASVRSLSLPGLPAAALPAAPLRGEPRAEPTRAEPTRAEPTPHPPLPAPVAAAPAAAAQPPPRASLPRFVVPLPARATSSVSGAKRLLGTPAARAEASPFFARKTSPQPPPAAAEPPAAAPAAPVAAPPTAAPAVAAPDSVEPAEATMACAAPALTTSAPAPAPESSRAPETAAMSAPAPEPPESLAPESPERQVIESAAPPALSDSLAAPPVPLEFTPAAPTSSQLPAAGPRPAQRTIMGMGIPSHPALAASLPFAEFTPPPRDTIPSQTAPSAGVPSDVAPEPISTPVPPTAPCSSPPDTVPGVGSFRSGPMQVDASRVSRPGMAAVKGPPRAGEFAAEPVRWVASMPASERRPSGWSHAPPRSAQRSRRSRRGVLGGLLATAALASAVSVALWLRPQSLEALFAAPPPAAAARGSALALPARAEPTPRAEPPVASPEAGHTALAPGAALAAVGESGAGMHGVSARLSDAQLVQLFALEPRQQLPGCSERPGARGRDAGRSRADLKAARSELQRGHNDKAQRLLCSATARSPSNLAAWQSLAELSLQLGDGARAKQVLEQALKQKPGQPALLGMLGDAWALLGDLQQSRALWAQSLPDAAGREQPAAQLAQVFAGLAERKQRSWSHASALVYYRRAAVLSGGELGPSQGMSASLRRLSRIDAAEAWAARSRALGPGAASVH